MLSLLLALFAILLSAMFYFKATESSNHFYDNTYKFTKELSELVGKLDVAVNKELQNVSKGYERLYEKVNGSNSSEHEKVSTEKIEIEKEKLNKLNNEKDKLIRELTQKAQMQKAELNKFVKELEDKNNKISLLSQNINELNFIRNDISHSNLGLDNRVLEGFENYIKRYVFGEIYDPIGFSELSQSSKRIFLRRFKDKLNKEFLEDMIRMNFLNDNLILSNEGIKLLERIAKSLY